MGCSPRGQEESDTTEGTETHTGTKKDTSLARVIMVPEMLKAAERFTMQGLIWPLFYTGVFFLIFNGALTLLFSFIEKKLSYYKG